MLREAMLGFMFFVFCFVILGMFSAAWLKLAGTVMTMFQSTEGNSKEQRISTSF